MVVVNDGSDDDTESVALKYKDRIQYLSQPNGGTSAARNAGLKLAKGKYLLFLDADDLLHRDAVAWQVEAMQGKDNRLCVMGFGRFRFDGALEEKVDKLPPDERPLERLLVFENLAPPHAFLSPRQMVVAIGGFDDRWTRSCEDWDLWIRLILAGAEIVVVSRVGAYYRRHEESATRNHLRMDTVTAELLLSVQKEMRNRPDLLQRWGLTYPQFKKRQKPIIVDAFLGAAYSLRKQGNYSGCLYYHLASLWRAGWNGQAVLGLIKLAPQKLLGR
jgi:glycosyltransferase involved in cell wall biosynthesis